MKMIKVELKRAFGSREMKVSLLLGMLLVVAQAIGGYIAHKHNILINQGQRLQGGGYAVGTLRDTLYESYLGREIDTFCKELYFYLLPILVALPFAGSFYRDRQSGYMKNLCCRRNKMTYYLAKYVAVFVSGSAAGSFPYLASFCLCALVYPADYPSAITMRTGALELSLFYDYYFLHPLVYTLLFLVIIALFSGVLATFSLLVSFWAKNILVVWFFPFMLYMAQRMLFVKLDIYQWSVAYMVNNGSKEAPLVRVTAWQPCMMFALLLALTLGGFLLVGKKKELIV